MAVLYRLLPSSAACRGRSTVYGTPFVYPPLCDSLPPCCGFSPAIVSYAEAIALSAMDAAVHSLSGFSLFALQWSGLPPSRIRLLPRYAKDLRGQPMQSCGDAAYEEAYYRVFRFGVEG